MAPEVVKRYTYGVEVKTEEANTRHFKAKWCVDHNHGDCASTPTEFAGKSATVPNMFDYSAEKFKSKDFFGTRLILEETQDGKKKFWKKGPFSWKTFGQAGQEVHSIAKGLLTLPGVKERKESGECIAALVGDTAADWQIAAQSAFQCGMAITTAYTTLGAEAMLYGLNQTEAILAFVDYDSYEKIKDTVLAKCPALKHIVLIGECFVPLKTIGGPQRKFPSAAEAADFPLVGEAKTCVLKSLAERGVSSGIDLQATAPTPDDVAFIMYTSGSTGLPKGVILSHQNFSAMVAGLDFHGGLAVHLTDDAIYMAYLPLAHMFELMVETMLLMKGVKIAYGNPKTLTNNSPFMPPNSTTGSDLTECRPTLMVGVPAILDGIKSAVMNKVSSGTDFTSALARAAIAGRTGSLETGGGCAGWLGAGCLQSYVIDKLKSTLGLDKVKMFASGGAPLSPETQNFMSQVFAPVSQGYGATEAGGASTMQSHGDRSTGTCGSIAPSCEVKLLSAPEMGYLVSDNPPRGEVLIAGFTVSQRGYYKMEEKSREDFPRHDDGKIWFHTGDIGVIMENGNLKIIDRKKDLIKLSGGEYVSLGKVEAGLKGVKGIAACCVFAQSSKDHCVVIVSQPERGWASTGGKPEEDTLVKALAESLRAQNFAKFEIPTKVKIDDEMWTPESGLVTASFKVQRNPIRNHYNSNGGLLAQMDYQFS